MIGAEWVGTLFASPDGHILETTMTEAVSTRLAFARWELEFMGDDAAGREPGIFVPLSQALDDIKQGVTRIDLKLDGKADKSQIDALTHRVNEIALQDGEGYERNRSRIEELEKQLREIRAKWAGVMLGASLVGGAAVQGVTRLFGG